MLERKAAHDDIEPPRQLGAIVAEIRDHGLVVGTSGRSIQFALGEIETHVATDTRSKIGRESWCGTGPYIQDRDARTDGRRQPREESTFVSSCVRPSAGAAQAR